MYLLEGDAEVNMYDLAIVVVHENIREMAVTQTNDVPNNRRRRDTPRVVQACSEPILRRSMVLGKIVTHNRMEPLSEVAV